MFADEPSGGAVDELMECPKCGFTQPTSEECIACGIIFAKYWAVQGRRPAEPSMAALPPEPVELEGPAVSDTPEFSSAPLSEAAPAHSTAAPNEVEPYQLEQEPGLEPSTTSFELAEAPPETIQRVPPHSTTPTHSEVPVQPSGQERAPLQPKRHRVLRHDARSQQTIGTSTMVIRSLAGVACLGIAVLMFANGKGLLSVWPYIIMVFYAGAALWGLSSFRQKISLQQFATEMALLVLVTLLMRVAAPEMFTVESPTQGTPKVVQPYLPKTSLGSFTKHVLVYAEAGHAVLESRDAVPQSQWDTWTQATSFKVVKSKYSVLTTEDRARVWDVWKRVEELGPMLTDALARYTEVTPDGVRFKAPENERAAVRRELDAALLKAGQLRARLLIYPETEVDY